MYPSYVVGGISAFIYFSALLFSDNLTLENKFITHQFLSFAIALFSWWIFGWGIANGKDNNAFSGNSNFADVSSESYCLFFYEFSLLSISLAVLYKNIYRSYTPLFSMAICFVYSSFCFPIVTHWMWSNGGWASPYRSTVKEYLLSGCGAIDSAGASVIHLTAGVSFLLFLIFHDLKLFDLQPFGEENISITFEVKGEKYAGLTSSIRFLIFTMSICGFFGINSLTNLPTQHTLVVVGRRILNTIICVSTSSFCTYFFTLKFGFIKLKSNQRATFLLDSAHSALVCISAGCSAIEPEGAFSIGILSSLLHAFTFRTLSKSQFSTFSSTVIAHIVSPIAGLLAVAFLASKRGYAISYANTFHNGSSRTDFCAGIFYGGGGNLLVANIAIILSVVVWSTVIMAPLFFLGEKYFKATDEEASSDFEEVRDDHVHDNIDYSSVLAKKLQEFEFDSSYPLRQLDFFHDAVNNNSGRPMVDEEWLAGRDRKSMRYSGWDVCFVFPITNKLKNITKRTNKKSGFDSSYKTQEHSEINTPAEIMKTLRAVGFDTFQFFSVQNDEIVCKVRLDISSIASHADDFNYKLLLDKSRLQRAAAAGCEKNVNGRPHTIKPIDIYDGKKEKITHMSPYEYIYAGYDNSPDLQELFANATDLDHPFSANHRLRIIRRIIEEKRPNTCGLNINGLIEDGLILAVFPLHNKHMVQRLTREWLQCTVLPWDFAEHENLVKDYFGERIALYFAFVSHYTTWLVIPTVLGVFVSINIIVNYYIYGRVLVTAIDNLYSVVIYCFLLCLWTRSMLVFWKRKESYIALRWGMTSYESTEELRHGFYGVEANSIIDGSPTLVFSNDEKFKRIRYSVCVIGAKLIFIIGCFSSIFYFKFFSVYVSKDPILNNYGSFVGDIFNAIIIQLLSRVYSSLSRKLTEFENCRTETEFEDSIITKLFVFEFINSYLPAFYIAFVKKSVGDVCFLDSCVLDLSKLLITFFLTQLFVNNLINVMSSKISTALKGAKETSSSSTEQSRQPSEAEKQYYLAQSDDPFILLGDYNQICVQYGFMTLFISACPFLPFIALVQNIVEIKKDGNRMLRDARRPFPVGAQDIGSWYSIFEIISVIAVFTNCFVVFFTMDIFDHFDSSLRVWLCFIFIVVTFCSRALATCLICDSPIEISIQLQRQQFLESKIIKKVFDEEDDTYRSFDIELAATPVLHQSDTSESADDAAIVSAPISFQPSLSL